jgi:hypothetical protein
MNAQARYRIRNAGTRHSRAPASATRTLHGACAPQCCVIKSRSGTRKELVRSRCLIYDWDQAGGTGLRAAFGQSIVEMNAKARRSGEPSASLNAGHWTALRLLPDLLPTSKIMLGCSTHHLTCTSCSSDLQLRAWGNDADILLRLCSRPDWWESAIRSQASGFWARQLPLLSSDSIRCHVPPY